MPVTGKYENRVGYPVGELGPASMCAEPGTSKKLLVSLTNGTYGMGDPSGLYLKMLRRPGYAKLTGRTPDRWWWGSFARDSTQDHQTYFTFPMTMLDLQLGREDWFLESEMVTVDFVWLA